MTEKISGGGIKNWGVGGNFFEDSKISFCGGKIFYMRRKIMSCKVKFFLDRSFLKLGTNFY